MDLRTKNKPLWTRHSCAVFLGSMLFAACADAADPPVSPPLVPSEDGASIIDLRARLVWPRCVEGMQWNGKTCTGTPQQLDYAQAVALANARWKSEGVRWRLPRANELTRLVDKTTRPPGLSVVLFPGAPPEWHWSGSANIQTGSGNLYNYGNVMRGGAGGEAGTMAFRQGWAVNLQTAESRGDVGKATRLPVRLVRPYEPDPVPVEGGQ